MSIAYQFSDEIYIDWLAKNMPQFLFPDLSKQQTRIEKAFSGVLASHNRKPVGLILATSESTGKIYRIHSFFIHPHYRNKKLGTTLLEKLELAILEKGGIQLEGTFKSHYKSKTYLERILANHHWEKPSPQLLILKGSTKEALEHWHEGGTSSNSFPLSDTVNFKPPNLKSNYSLYAFTQLKKKDVAYIQKQQFKQLPFDSNLHPFLEFNSVDTHCSFLVKNKNQIVGWIVSHRIKQNLNEITALYLSEQFRTYKLAYNLIKKVFERQLALGITDFMTSTKLDGNPVAKVILRKVPKTKMRTTTVFYTCKKLSKY